jgi:hypothetical protein
MPGHPYATPQRPSQQLGRPLRSELEDVILRCLHKAASERPSSAAELVRALEAGARGGVAT